MSRLPHTKLRRLTSARLSRSGARRLTMETMESRLLLSGNQLDDTVWNLDSLSSGYLDLTFASPSDSRAANAGDGKLASGGAGVLGDPAGPQFTAMPGSGQFFVNASNPDLPLPSLTQLFGVLPNWQWAANPLTADLLLQFQLAGDKLTLGPASSGDHLLIITTPSTNELPLAAGDLRGMFVFDAGQLLAGYFDSVGKAANTPPLAWSVADPRSAGDQESALAAPAEGGEVPLGPLVGAVASDFNPSPRTVATHIRRPQPADLSGEMARAVVFEVLDSSTPVVFAATEHRLAPLAASPAAAPLDLLPPVGAPLDTVSAASGLAATQPSRAAVSRTAAAGDSAGESTIAVAHGEAVVEQWAALVRGWATPAAAVPLAAEAVVAALRAEAARTAAFAAWDSNEGERVEGDGPAAESATPAAAAKSLQAAHGWLAATPLLAMLAAERYVARKLKRDDLAPSDN